MAESSSSSAVQDLDGILKQLSVTFAAQQAKISSLENLLRISEAEGKQLQIECHKWKSKCDRITKLCIGQIGSLAALLDNNADAGNMLTEVSFADSCNSMVEYVHQVVRSPKSVPQNVDEPLKDSKVIVSIEDRSPRQNDGIIEIHEVKVESDVENFVTNEENSVTNDENSVTNDENSVTNDENSVTNEGNSVRNQEISVTNEEISVTNEEVSVTNEEISVTNEEISVTNEEISVTSEENSDTSDEQGSDESSDETDIHSDSSEQERGVHREKSKADVVSVVDSDIISLNQSSSDEQIEEISDTENNLQVSDVDERSEPFTNDDSTSMSEDSDKELQIGRKQKTVQGFRGFSDDYLMSNIIVNKSSYVAQSELDETQPNAGAATVQKNGKATRSKTTKLRAIRADRNSSRNSFQCNVCQKQFLRKSYLKQHSKSHTDKVFQCGLCKIYFRSKQNVDRHVNNGVCKIMKSFNTEIINDTDGEIFDLKTEPQQRPSRYTTTVSNKRKVALDAASEPLTKMKSDKVEDLLLIDKKTHRSLKMMSVDSGISDTMYPTCTIKSSVGSFIVTDDDIL